MATKDEKGFIHYTQAELNRIPSFEQGDDAGMTPAAGGTLGTVGGAVLGAGLGSTVGPGGTVVGGFAGAAGGAAFGATTAKGQKEKTRS